MFFHDHRVEMKTRRESVVAAAQPAAGVPAFAGANETALPTQQQRVLAQLKTAMLALNKRHGSATTNEVLNQIISSIAIEEDRALNFKPEYSDVLIDSELSVPPVPEQIVVKKQQLILRPVPQWFSFDGVSEAETAHFGPLFSMDEERWKMYLSLRNDAVRIYEDLIAHMAVADRANLFLNSSDLRLKLHPKDDAAYVFEIWKFLTSAGVINRGRCDTGVVAVAGGDGVNISGEQAIPPQKPAAIHTSGFTRVNCATCSRECRFFCYKPLPPPESPEGLADLPLATDDLTEVKDEPMGEPKESYMCHDCTPAFFEKIPLRLFIDQDTKERMLRGEFEEVSVDDVRSFLISPEPSLVSEAPVRDTARARAAELLLSRFTKESASTVVKSWDHYVSLPASEKVNPLEILDPMMQDALSGAGQKIRGSVLIEQQVRNMVYGASVQNEDVEPVCPTDVETAYAIVEELLTRVSKTQSVPESVKSSPPFVTAKKTDPVHFELLSIVWMIAAAARELKKEQIAKLDVGRLESLARERVQTRREFLQYLKSLRRDEEMITSGGVVHDSVKSLFVPVKIDSSVKLASLNPKQLRLVSL